MKTNYPTNRLSYKSFIFFALLCVVTNSAWAEMATMSRIFKQNAYLEEFEVCHSGGCAEVNTISLSQEEWKAVADLFEPAPDNAAQEREVIKLAIGAIEHLVGPKTGTDTDKGGTFGNSGFKGQMDCNDEATNTSTYLKLLMHDGLVKFHQLEDTKTRKFFFNGWPHSAAVIKETATGEKYAVDSWFYDNGQPAEIVPLQVWLDGWKPSNSLAH